MKANAKEVVSHKITLEMTGEQAEVLYAITQFVAGNPDGPRGVVDEFAEALKNSLKSVDQRAFETFYTRFIDKEADREGVITMKSDYPKKKGE